MPAGSAAILVALAAVVALALGVLIRQAPPLRRRLVLILAVALTLRVSLGVVLHLTGAWHITQRGAVTPDEAVIDYAARLRQNGDQRSPVMLGGSLHTAWLLVAAAVYELWNSILALKLVNALLGTVLVLPTFLLGRDLHSDKAGIWAAWGMALLPTAVVWSALALREPLIALTLTTLVLTALRLFRSRRLAAAAAYGGLSAIALLVLGFTRSYMVPLMILLLLGAGVAAAVRERGLRPVGSALLVGTVGLGIILAVPRGVELARTTIALTGEQAPTVYNPFSDCSDESKCLPEGSGPPLEAFDPPRNTPGAPRSEDASGPPASRAAPLPLSDSLQSVGEKGVVRAFAIAMLAGRPVWLTRDFFFLLQPGVVVWWTGLPLAVLGSVFLVVRRRLPELALLVGFCAAVVVFLAYSGQFIRHHYMIEPVAVALAALGASWMAETPSCWLRRAAILACGFMAVAAAASVTASLL